MSSNVVPLFDPVTMAILSCQRIANECGAIADRVDARRGRVQPLFDPKRGAVRVNAQPTPIFDPITMTLREIDCTIERLEAAVRAQRS
jgi:hypothetical protein